VHVVAARWCGAVVGGGVWVMRVRARVRLKARRRESGNLEVLMLPPTFPLGTRAQESRVKDSAAAVDLHRILVLGQFFTVRTPESGPGDP